VTDDPLTEKEVDTQRGPLRIPDYTYGWAKMSGEFIAGLAREKYGLPVVIYRPFSVYGPGQGSDYPIPAIVARTARKEDPLTIWGSGLQVRDFVYIDDFLAIVMGSYRTLPFAEPLNISTGRGVNFHEVGQTAATVAGYAPRIAADASQPAGVLCRVGSIAAIPERLRPRVSLREGLTKMFQHLSPRNRCSSILN
jgi:UDP-glucose 4-epimerase